jgi:hypothetical protein
MTDRTSGQHRTTAGMGDALRWLNTSGETIPAYGVIQLRANYTSGYNQASKPDDAQGLFFANGPVAVLATKKGESLLWNRPRRVKVEGSPAVGTQVGPVADSWSMSEEGVGFYVMHQPVDGVATVVQVGAAGGGGGGHTIWFTISEILCPETDYVDETTLVVVATWYNQSCTGIPPGANDDGTYDVYDLCSYLNGLTPTDLAGGTGRATYHYPLTGYCEPRWIIDDLCPQPECQ